MANAGRVAIVPQDNYDNTKSYKRLDMVSYSGGLYVAKKETAGNLPTNTEYWMKIGEFTAQIMSTTNNGVGKPDGVTITVNEDGTFSVNGDISGGIDFRRVASKPDDTDAEDKVIYLVETAGATGQNKFIWYTLMHDDADDVDKLYCINDYGMDFANYVDKESYRKDMGAVALKTTSKVVKGAINENYDSIDALKNVVGDADLETTAQTVTEAVNEVNDAVTGLSFLTVAGGAVCVTYEIA